MFEDKCDSFFVCSFGNMTMYNVCPDGYKFSDSAGKVCVKADEGYAGCMWSYMPTEEGCFNDPTSNAVRQQWRGLTHTGRRRERREGT